MVLLELYGCATWSKSQNGRSPEVPITDLFDQITTANHDCAVAIIHIIKIVIQQVQSFVFFLEKARHNEFEVPGRFVKQAVQTRNPASGSIRGGRRGVHMGDTLKIR